jgi:hypothetical protein
VRALAWASRGFAEPKLVVLDDPGRVIEVTAAHARDRAVVEEHEGDRLQAADVRAGRLD